MEAMQSKGNEVFTTERKSVALDPKKHDEVAQKRKILIFIFQVLKNKKQKN